ncbi:MAG: HAMP domain-containing protein [Rhodocyclales bacterium]|nr:HAMP domain-containing protein [Rhodocyclales bacterium]
MKAFNRFQGLSSKIYIAFLVAAGLPVMVAGLVGIYSSLETLRQETLHHLEQEVQGRAAGMGHFFDQLASELLYLASSSLLYDLANSSAAPDGKLPVVARQRLERDYAAFARAYPYIYQVRFLDAQGREVVRVDRRDGRLVTVAETDLQNKSDRYYFHEGLAHEAGQVYVSPLDLNVERGQAEKPERPVIRFATPIVDRRGGKRGLLIVNLHAAYILGQIQEMAGGRGGVAYLFDRSGFYLSRSAGETGSETFRMESVEALADLLPRPLLARVVGGKKGTEIQGNWIFAYAPIAIGRTLADRSDSSLAWSVALAFPRSQLFQAIFNLYLLYGVLALSLFIAAVSGFLLSRHLLRPLTLLSSETEEIAKGNFAHRVEIRGDDEIAELGARFNSMAAELEQSYKALENRKGELEAEVQARTADLERERSQLAAVISNTADGILSTGTDGEILLANNAARRYLINDTGILVGRSIGEFWPGWAEYVGQPATLLSASNFDLTMQGRTLSLGIAPVLTGRTSAGFILVVRDVTVERRLQDDRRELDRQMFQMEKMATLGEVAMGLAHEIGNPLAGMKAVVQLLLEDKLEEAQHEYLLRVQGEINRLADFLRTFHGFAAPQEMKPAPCRLEQVLEDVMLWTRKEARSRKVAISYAPCCEQVPELWADPAQLKQVLLNLVINAIHAMPEGGSVEVGMCAGVAAGADGADRPRMRFCVRDTGVGIVPELQARIFDPFFTTRSDGSGIGLAVVKKIAVQHGADIHVESSPGHGSCFALDWPIADTSVQTLTAAATSAPCCRREANG